MATYYAVAAGNFNATSTWSTTPAGAAGFGPPIAGDTAVANNRAVAVTASATCLQVRNDTSGGATAGGTFTLSNGVTLTANSLAGSSVTPCVTFSSASPSAASIVGNCTGGSASGARGALNSSTGTLTITGNLLGGSASTQSNGAGNTSTGTINVTGNVTGGSAGEGCRNSLAGIINITGIVTGGSGSGAVGILNVSTGIVNVTGTMIGGSVDVGASNSSTGTIIATRVVGNGYGPGSAGLFAAVGVANSALGVVSVEELEYGTLGMSPTSGAGIRLKKLTNNVAKFNYCDSAGSKTLVDATQGQMPAETDVRFGTSYASGALTGSAYIPSAGSVAFGVPVDATTGTATLTAQNVRDAIGLSTANLDTQLASIPTAAGNASAVRTELAPELTEIGEIHAIHGLDIANALTVTPTLRSAGAITQAITGDGTTSTIVTRV